MAGIQINCPHCGGELLTWIGKYDETELYNVSVDCPLCSESFPIQQSDTTPPPLQKKPIKVSRGTVPRGRAPRKIYPVHHEKKRGPFEIGCLGAMGALVGIGMFIALLWVLAGGMITSWLY
jgi:endogenous inhibitor of DNA gyrase (YacG/DUF329 family)